MDFEGPLWTSNAFIREASLLANGHMLDCNISASGLAEVDDGRSACVSWPRMSSLWKLSTSSKLS